MLNIVVEGDVDVVVVRRLATWTGFEIGDSYVMGGKGLLDKRIGAFNAAARVAPWFALRDLDDDAECGAELVSKLLPRRARKFLLRVAVHEVEAWLLGDRRTIADALQVRVGLVPARPEDLARPKQRLVQIARSSRARAVREDLVPAFNSTARVGPAYTAWVSDFMNRWSPQRARGSCPSLDGAIRALRGLRAALR